MAVAPPVTPSRSRTASATNAPSRPRTSQLWATWVPAALIVLLAGVVAWQVYDQFLDVHRSLWDRSTHDRNAHYLYSLKLATALWNGDLYQLAIELNSARVWPPLHGILTTCCLLVGGLDYRLAVLPSLLGWVGMVTFAFLLARRAVPRGGNLAGLTAALLLMVSPAYRSFATDIMLESLGACLTVAVLYAYVVTVQSRKDAWWTGSLLGLALTLLFLEKYNYWLIALLTLLATEGLTRARTCWHLFREGFARVDWSTWGKAQLKHPLNWLFLTLLTLIGVVLLRGDHPLPLGTYSVDIYPPHNLVHAAYVVFFLRLLSWWRGGLSAWVGSLDGRLRQVILWHVWPVAVWFLLPRHLSYFLWYLSLGNASPDQHLDLLAGLTSYGKWLFRDYHPTIWLALLVAILFPVGLLSWRGLRQGGQAVLLLVLIAGALTVVHPNRKSRNLHSWLAVTWVTAGIGLASLLPRRGRVRRPLGFAIAVGLGFALLPTLEQKPPHAPEGGPHPDLPSMLDLTDFYLADLAESRKATILASVPVQPLVEWTFLERYGQLTALEEHWQGFGPAGPVNQQAFVHWLQTTDCDTIVFFDRLPGAYYWEEIPEVALHAELRDSLLGQHRFHLAKQEVFLHHGCRMMLWQRK
jgi:hypothetical protein